MNLPVFSDAERPRCPLSLPHSHRQWPPQRLAWTKHLMLSWMAPLGRRQINSKSAETQRQAWLKNFLFPVLSFVLRSGLRPGRPHYKPVCVERANTEWLALFCDWHEGLNCGRVNKPRSSVPLWAPRRPLASFPSQVSGRFVRLWLADAPSDNINLFNLNWWTPAQMLLRLNLRGSISCLYPAF